MTDNKGFDQPPPYSANQPGFSNQYGADYGVPKGGTYPPQGGAYPPQGGGYPSAGAAYPPQGGNFSQIHSQQSSTTVPGVAGHVVVRPRPPDYMAASVIACLCCFWPTGLCAIYYASQANAFAAKGDMETATRMSYSARNLMISSIVIGIIWITLVIILRGFVYSYTYYN